MVFDEFDCDRMEHALNRAYFLFMQSGRLSASNMSIAKAVLSRAILKKMEEGERDELQLARSAVNSFEAFKIEIVERDKLYLVGTPDGYQALSR